MRYRRGWDARLVRWLFLVPRWAAATEPSWFYPWITPTTRLHTLPCVTYHTSSSRRLLEFGASVSLACRPPRSRSRAGAEAGQEQVAEHRSVPRCAGCSSPCCRLSTICINLLRYYFLQPHENCIPPLGGPGCNAARVLVASQSEVLFTNLFFQNEDWFIFEL
jgi:hypothetical protein